MISDNIKAIFTFLEFINSSIEKFNKQSSLLKEIELLRKEYNELNPKLNFEDKFKREGIKDKRDKLIALFNSKCKDEVNEKINELQITDLKNFGNKHFYHIGELLILIQTENYEREDVNLILEAKRNYISILENLKTRLENFIPYDLVRDFREDLLDCFQPFLDKSDKIIIANSQFILGSDNWVKLDGLVAGSIEKGVRELVGNSNKLNFNIFTDFLEYLKENVNHIALEGEPYRILEKYKSILQSATFQSEIDEVKQFSEKSIKDLKNDLLNFYQNENYKTNYDGSINPRYLQRAKAYFEYQKLYDETLLKEALPPQQKQEEKPQTLPENNAYNFSALEWGAIFYFADLIKSFSSLQDKSKKRKKFYEVHNLKLSFDHFSNKCIEADNRINYTSYNNLAPFPLEKLQKIQTFINENYPLAKISLANSITFIKENDFDY